MRRFAGTDQPGIDRRVLAAALRRAERAAGQPGVTAGLRRPVRHLRPALQRVLGTTEVTCTIFTGQRMRVVLPEIVGTALYRHGYIEAPLTHVLLDRLRPGMVFVDVGAQYGYHSLVASLLVGPAGSVLALEPGRGVLPLLRRNTGEATNVTVDAVAACAGSGTVTFRDFGPAHSSLGTLFPHARIPRAERQRLNARAYPVRSVGLDDHLFTAGLRPDFVKLDAEGSELDILHGMRRALEEVGPVLAMEAGDYEGMSSPDTASCIDFLEGLGYRALEYADGLRPHARRARYGYDNLFFVKG
jgi:FkbM family methyltransferase